METLQLDIDDQTIKNLKFDHAIKVPSMLDGFTIHTKYGTIEIEPESAKEFFNLTADVLQGKLNKLRTY